MDTKPKRILYIDILRAFAVIMMIQGHTVDTFLAEEYRTTESTVYSIWYTLRGFTAPIFMFAAGLVFTYLLKSDEFEFLKNPRIKKGIKRGVLLLIIGYLLRYPTYRFFDFSYVSQVQWDIFFAVDALHLIGSGMLIIIISVFLSKYLRINLYGILSIIIISILLFSPYITKIEWLDIFPQYIASYFTNKYGSLFPLFPWLIYVLGGGLLGNYLYKNEGIHLKKRYYIFSSTLGASLIFLSMLFFYIEESTQALNGYWFHANGMIFLRIGYVIVLNGLLAFLVRKLGNIPSFIKETGRKTLLLYVVHVVLLYGSAWFPGLYRYYAKSYNPIETIVAVCIIMISMLAIVLYTDKINIFKKRRVLLKKV